jgi:hypothetical protein
MQPKSIWTGFSIEPGVKVAGLALALSILVLQFFTLSAIKNSNPEILRGISLRVQRHLELVSAGSKPAAFRESELLQGYLAGLRKDGVAAHSAEKQRIEAIAANLSEVDALLSVYKPKGDGQAFQQRQQEFEAFSTAWRNRAGSILGIYLLGGNLPTEPLAFPEAFSAEIARQEKARGIL